MAEDFYYPSAGKGNIRARCWKPEDKPCGIVQIVHGISEHVERYDEFANFLCSQGYLVVAQDHMGHGKSGLVKGYFHGGWFAAVTDTYQLLQKTKEAYADIPYILFGHSMGSFLTRSILAKYPQSGITGAIICGTAWMPETVLSAGKFMAGLACKWKGEECSGKLLQSIMFAGYNKRVEHPATAFDWLTRDRKILDIYIRDPDCGFSPTAGLARDMLAGMQYNQKKASLDRMNKDLPVLFISGSDDPVGDYGSGVKRTAQAFIDAGMKSVSVKLYPLCRHEILNEINRSSIYRDAVQWIRNL